MRTHIEQAVALSLCITAERPLDGDAEWRRERHGIQLTRRSQHSLCQLARGRHRPQVAHHTWP